MFLIGVKANKVNNLDQVECKWDNRTMVKCRADHRVKMANRTSEATREVVAEATSNVDVEEVDKVAEVATTRTLINQEAHNNKGTRWDQTR